LASRNGVNFSYAGKEREAIRQAKPTIHVVKDAVGISYFYFDV